MADGADGKSCLVQCLRDVPSATHFACGKMLRVVGVFGVAVCFAGFVQFLLLNKNCTRAVDEFYLADKVSPPALSATHFALRQNATVVGRFGSAVAFKGNAA